MAISDVSPKISYVSDGVISQYNYPFRILEENDLIVFVDDVEQSSGFTITGVNQANGGTVNFTIAPQVGSTIILQRFVTKDRSIEYTIGGKMDAETFNYDFDRTVMMIQDERQNVEDKIVLATSEKDAAIAAQLLAEQAATNASTSESNASTSESNALTSEANALTSANNASTSEANAATSEINSLNYSNKAHLWAEELEDVEVETGKYSAFHWATKAQQSVTIAGVSSVNTRTGDVVLTASDVGLGNVDNTADLDKPISTDTINYVDTQDSLKVSKSGDTMSGELWLTYGSSPAIVLKPTLSGGSPQIRMKDSNGATRGYFYVADSDGSVNLRRDDASSNILTIVTLSDDGNLDVSGSAPTAASHLTRKDYVDTQIANNISNYTITKADFSFDGFCYIVDGSLYVAHGSGASWANYYLNLATASNSSPFIGASQFGTKVSIPGDPTIVDVVMIGRNILALTDTGVLWGWGYNTYGELGKGTTTPVWLPSQLLVGVEKIFNLNQSYGANNPNCFIRKTDGTIWATGYNGYGELGIGSATGTITTWTQVTGIPAGSEIYGSNNYKSVVFALAPDKKTLYGWGYNGTGALGDGTTVNKTAPVDLTSYWNPSAFTITHIQSVGSYYGTAEGNYQSTSIAMNDGTTYKVLSAGYNAQGQLGNGTTTNSSSPVESFSSTTLIRDFKIEANMAVAALLLDNNELWKWGYNGYGNVGNGTTTNTLSPTLIDSNVSDLLSTPIRKHTYGVTYQSFIRKTDGYIYSVGYNTYGECGTILATDPITSYTKVSIKNPSEVIAIGYVAYGQAGVRVAYSAKQIQVCGYNGNNLITNNSTKNMFVFADINVKGKV